MTASIGDYIRHKRSGAVRRVKAIESHWYRLQRVSGSTFLEHRLDGYEPSTREEFEAQRKVPTIKSLKAENARLRVLVRFAFSEGWDMAEAREHEYRDPLPPQGVEDGWDASDSRKALEVKKS